jgi:arylsulfatase A-like enzyme
VGKWGLGGPDTTGEPNRQGFDYFYGYLCQRHAHNYYPEFLFRNRDRVVLEGNRIAKPRPDGAGFAVERAQYSHDLIAGEVLAFVDRHQDGPFFLYLAMTIPHANNEAGRKGMEVPDLGEYADKDWPAPQKGTAAMITRMDRDIGRLFDRLKRHGIDDRTVVMFTSDNGPHAEGGNNPHFFDSNGPLRGIKRDLYDGGIRVPMIARWPGQIEAGATNGHIGYFGDLMATAAELAGIETPSGLNSISLVPTLLGDDDRQQNHRYLYWEFYRGRRMAQAVRMGPWKGMRNAADAPMELYDITKDIGETENVAADHEDVVDEIETAMQEAHVPSEIWSTR